MKIVMEDGDEEWLVDLIARAPARSQRLEANGREWMTVAEVSEHLRIPEDHARSRRATDPTSSRATATPTTSGCAATQGRSRPSPSAAATL